MFRIPRTPLLPAIVAAALTLTACGGGGPGGSSGDGPRPVASTHSRANPAALDPRDSWADPAPLRAALGLSPVTDPGTRVAALRALANAPARTDIGNRSLLERIDPDSVEILGQRDGIVYGQWKAGPTETLDIDFDWRFAPNVDAQSRALMERAGKAWSRRLTDELPDHTVPAGTDIGFRDITKTLDQPVTTDGIVIFVIDKGAVDDNVSTAGPVHVPFSDDEFQPRLGRILLNRKHHDSRSLMLHEIGHVLGIVSHLRHHADGRYVDTEDHVFTGPNAVRANGGRPVPYQWVDAENNHVAPGTPGAEVDYGHIAVCTSIMAYCRDRSVVVDPSELDFAILDDIGYDILDAATASQPEFYGYGAWANYSAWGIGVERGPRFRYRPASRRRARLRGRARNPSRRQQGALRPRGLDRIAARRRYPRCRAPSSRRRRKARNRDPEPRGLRTVRQPDREPRRHDRRLPLTQPGIRGQRRRQCLLRRGRARPRQLLRPRARGNGRCPERPRIGAARRIRRQTVARVSPAAVHPPALGTDPTAPIQPLHNRNDRLR